MLLIEVLCTICRFHLIIIIISFIIIPSFHSTRQPLTRVVVVMPSVMCLLIALTLVEAGSAVTVFRASLEMDSTARVS